MLLHDVPSIVSADLLCNFPIFILQSRQDLLTSSQSITKPVIISIQTPTPCNDKNPCFCQVPSFVTPMLITVVSPRLTCSCDPSSKENKRCMQQHSGEFVVQHWSPTLKHTISNIIISFLSLCYACTRAKTMIEHLQYVINVSITIRTLSG